MSNSQCTGVGEIQIKRFPFHRSPVVDEKRIRTGYRLGSG